MNEYILNQKTPNDIAAIVVVNIKRRRKSLGLTQTSLAQRANVSLGSIKRFEKSGEISLKSLLKIAIVLNCEEDFLSLFKQKFYTSIEEVVNEQI